jgi:hypothetical protein
MPHSSWLGGMWNLLTLRGICAQPAIYFLISPQGAGSLGQKNVNKASVNDAIDQIKQTLIKLQIVNYWSC